MSKPTGTPEYAQESLRERAGYWVGDKLDKASRADTAIGPAEAAFTYVAFALAGGLASLIPVVIFRKPWLLAVCPPVGIIGGLLLAIPVRGIRLGQRMRFGIIGATLFAVLLLCLSCGLVQTIAVSQKTMQGMDYWRRAEELGLYTPSEPTAAVGGIPIPMVVGLLTVCGIPIVAGVLLVVGIVILKKRS